MRIVFLGTPDFAVPTLDALSEHYDVVAVVTQPDRERDRKGNFIIGAVKARATELNIPVYQFEKIRTDGVQTLKDLAPELMVTCAYGQILSQEILDIPKYGVLNVHGSLLPKYRGSAPIQRAIMNGDEWTGITVMRTDIGMDSGDVVSMEKVAIDRDDYVDELYAKLSKIGANLLIKTIPDYILGKIQPVAQDESEVTYAAMLKKEEAFIDFNDSAERIRNTIRGMGYGVCSYKGVPVKVYKLTTAEGSGKPGEVLAAAKRNLTVACGEGALNFEELQLSGKKRMKTIDFLNGVKIAAGEFFEANN